MTEKNNKTIKAKDQVCIICEEQAVAFWPIIDSDITSNPYCRECLDTVKARVMKRCMEVMKHGIEEYRKLQSKFDKYCDGCSVIITDKKINKNDT